MKCDEVEVENIYPRNLLELGDFSLQPLTNSILFWRGRSLDINHAIQAHCIFGANSPDKANSKNFKGQLVNYQFTSHPSALVNHHTHTLCDLLFARPQLSLPVKSAPLLTLFPSFSVLLYSEDPHSLPFARRHGPIVSAHSRPPDENNKKALQALPKPLWVMPLSPYPRRKLETFPLAVQDAELPLRPSRRTKRDTTPWTAMP